MDAQGLILRELSTDANLPKGKLYHEMDRTELEEWIREVGPKAKLVHYIKKNLWKTNKLLGSATLSLIQDSAWSEEVRNLGECLTENHKEGAKELRRSIEDQIKVTGIDFD